MTHETRDSLIDSYFAALDEEDMSILESSLDSAFVYESLSEVFEGYDGIQRYMNQYRTFSGTDHQIQKRIHGENGSVAEGFVVGYDEDDERVEAKFCDVFEFTDDDTAITRLTVYLNDQIDPGLFEA